MNILQSIWLQCLLFNEFGVNALFFNEFGFNALFFNEFGFNAYSSGYGDGGYPQGGQAWEDSW